MRPVSHVVIRKRAACLFILVMVIMVALIGRLAYLQIFKSGWLADNAIDQRVRKIPVEAGRGTIYDRNGRELAVSLSSESVYAIPAEIQECKETAAKLAAILALDEGKLQEKLMARQAFMWIKRKVDAPTAYAIKQLNLPGIGITQETRRFYPNDNLAAHILGFVGIDNQGLDGVELVFDENLRGKAGSIVIEYDGRGREIPQATHRFVPPVPGNPTYLTIDSIIQKIVEREIEKVMQTTQAKAATIIVMDPSTGEILALANRPDYNPNQFADFPPQTWRNIAISNVYEPGSTFKILTVAAALQTQVVDLQEHFFDPGSVEVQGHNIRCWKLGGHGSQTFSQVVENSCNVGFVNVGLRLGPELFPQYIQKFGFGRLTGIDLPGEAKGIVTNQSAVKAINLATMAMGQGIAVTPLQLITAVAGVVNGGQLLRPQIVREIRDESGTLLRPFAIDIQQQVIEPTVSHQLNKILEQVVARGTGKNARVEGVRIGGKTGTAQKAGPGGYLAGKYIASFAGFWPTENPRVAALVVIDEPVGFYYGGQIAAPVFQAMMIDILQYYTVQGLKQK